MIVDYKLEGNKYFKKMWKTRNRFIPVYFKENFYPFLQTLEEVSRQMLGSRTTLDLHTAYSAS